jgi:hypothetical protein
MRFSGRRYWLLVGVIGLALGFIVRAAPTDKAGTNNKVIIYPGPTDSIDQLKQQGIEKVDNYGSYWVAEVGEKDLAKLKVTFGDRTVPANDLNHIELRAASFDTTGNEPAAPAGMEQVEKSGPRLRIVQFKGPIQPEWLAKLKSLNGAKVINYIPNNAYLVFMDAGTENKLEEMRGPGGFIQWIGAYHPYYKIPEELRSVSGTRPIKVRVAVVDRSQEPQGASRVYVMGAVEATMTRSGQQFIEMHVQPSDIAKIARLSDVLWIQKVEPKRLLDEVQDLLVATQTNQLPGHSPVPPGLGGIDYLQFLTNVVAGGLASFTNQFAYPIVDVADTGLDVGRSVVNGVITVVQPVFYEFGNQAGASRVAYEEPPSYIDQGTVQLGCGRLDRFFTGAEDFYEHGTLVASVLAGYDVQTNNSDVCITSTIVSQVFFASSVCAGTGSQTNTFFFPTQPCPLVTNLVVTCGSIGQQVFQVLTLPTEVIVTNTVNSTHQDPSGFQLGLGVSPFGQIGISRVWSQSAHTEGTPPVAVIDPTTFCINSLPSFIASAYGLGARIQNDSWSDGLLVDGSNGGQYNDESQIFDVAVRDALLVGRSNNVPGPSPLNQEFIVVFAANSGLGDEGANGTVGGFGDIRLTAPATAKNVITVGSSESVRLDGSGCAPADQEDNSFLQPPFTAFGPTVDGRFKPEIVAPGTTIFGATSELALGVDAQNNIFPLVNQDACGNLGGLNVVTCTLTNVGTCFPFIGCFPRPATTYVGGGLYECDPGGSSFAAPAVSGASQLLWWYFQNRLTDELGTPLLQPSPAMAKAYLCNSARYLPITNPQTRAMDTLPSNAQGMGELDLQKMFDGVPRLIRDESTPRAIDPPLIATNPASQQTYFSQSGQSYEVSGQVFDPTKPFRVSLAWTDAAGVPGAAKELVNNLDLQVTIGGVAYKGNVFSEDHSVSAPSSAFDNINNMESVFLPAGQTGVWSVIIRAVDIAGDGVPNVGSGIGQDFALVVYNAASTNRSDVPNLLTNNSCQTALILTQFPTSFSNTLSKAVYSGKSMPNPSAGRGGVEEFFKIVKPTPGTTFTVNTQGSSFNTVLSVWTVAVLPQTVFVRGECGALTELVSTNGGFGSQVTFAADGSNDYYIVAEPLNNGPGGNFVLNVSASNAGITVTPSSLSFGAQTLLTASNPQTVTYQNSTTVPVQITDLTITGPNAADFSLASQTCRDSVLAPGVNCTVAVVFSPQAGPLGLRQATLVFTDDATGSPRIVPLSGTATPAAPVLCLSLNAGTGTLSFGNQLLTTTSAGQSITITNCGSAALNISSVSITGFGSNDFAFSQSPACTGGPIAPGGFCTLNVTFKPQLAGTRSATLVITDDAAGSPTTVSLTGVGVALAPSVCFSRSSINFGSTVVGFTSSVQSVVITNCGTAALAISNLFLTGANPGDFIIVSNSCAIIATGNTCLVTLQFAPTAGGLRSANFALEDNASGSPQLLPLTGNGGLSQPDAAIGRTPNVRRMVGAGIENTTGDRQEIKQFIRRGARRPLRFYVTLRNIGSAPDRFTVQGDGNDTGFTVHYYLGSVVKDSLDVSSAVESGVFSSSTLAAGAITSTATMIRVEIFADKALVERGVTKTFKLTFSSAGDPTKVDVVKITVKTR